MLLWRPGAGRQVAAGVGILLAGATVLAASVVADDEFAQFAGAFGNVAPFVLLAVLAQLLPVWPALRPLTWLVFGLLLMVGLLVVVAVATMPFGLGPGSRASTAAILAPIVALGLGLYFAHSRQSCRYGRTRSVICRL